MSISNGEKKEKPEGDESLEKILCFMAESVGVAWSEGMERESKKSSAKYERKSMLLGLELSLTWETVGKEKSKKAFWLKKSSVF